MQRSRGLTSALLVGALTLVAVGAVVLALTGACIALANAPAWIRISLVVLGAWLGLSAIIRADRGSEWDRYDRRPQ